MAEKSIRMPRIIFDYAGKHYRHVLDQIGKTLYECYDEIWHYHGVYHLILVSNGRHYLDLKDPDRTLLLEKNSLILINPFVPHRMRKFEGETFEHTTLLWRLKNPKDRCLRTPLQSFYRQDPDVPGCEVAILSEEDALYFGREVVRLTGFCQNMLEDESWEMPFFAFWYNCLRFFTSSTGDDPQEDYWVARINNLLMRNFSNPGYSLADLADELERHPNYLGSLYRKKCGFSVSTELNRLRMRQAALLLRETSLSIHDIALRCGCRPGGRFAEKFRTYSGLLPLQYRKQFTLRYGSVSYREEVFQSLPGLPPKQYDPEG